jgi:uncharacterized protein with PIN domain
MIEGVCAMQAYIRKLNGGCYYVILGLPKNHANNTVLDEVFYTRRMAERYIKKHGYDYVKRTSDNLYENKNRCSICNGSFKPPKGEGAVSYLSKSIIMTYAEIQKKSKDDDCAVCPRCGIARMKPGLTRNALSRHADIYVCDICGTDEAVRIYSNHILPFEDWYVAFEILNYKKDGMGMP